MHVRSAFLFLCLAAGCSSFNESGGAPDGGGARPLPDTGALPADARSRADVGTLPHDSGTKDSGVAPDARAEAGSPADAPSTTGDAGCGDAGCPEETVADGLRQAGFIAIDDHNVYISDEGTVTGTVYQCAKTGCATPILLGAGEASGIAVDAANVYWSDFSSGQIYSCTIGGCGGAPKAIATGQTEAQGVGMIGTTLFWAAGGKIVTCTAPDCATPTTLATGQSPAVMQIAADQGLAFWPSSGLLMECPLVGCVTPKSITSALGGNVIAAGSDLYYVNNNAILSCPASSGTCTSPRTVGSSYGPFGVGSDGSFVYWLDDTANGVFRCPIGGCLGTSDTFVADGQASPGANVVLDSDYAYWSVTTTVMRKHK